MTTIRRLAILVAAAVALVAAAPLVASLCAASDASCPMMTARAHRCCDAPAELSPAMACCESPVVTSPAPVAVANPPQAAAVATAVAVDVSRPGPPAPAGREAPRAAHLQQELGLHVLHEVFLN